MEHSKLDISEVPHALLYEEVLSAQLCETLITKFEANEDRVQELTTGTSTMPRNFTEINISQHWHDEHDLMVNVVQGLWKSYMTHYRILFDVQWPRQFGYEQFRMKRYLPNDKDQFAHHTDVGSYASSRRFLAFLWYLNTVDQGGETGFGKTVDTPDLIIPAVRGRVLMFPPLWTHPHWGSKVLSGPKYVISSYLHYI